MIGAISVIGTRWLHNIQISFGDNVQEASGEFNNCSYMMQNKGRAAMNFIIFIKKGQSGFIQRK